MAHFIVKGVVSFWVSLVEAVLIWKGLLAALRQTKNEN
jgi:hypothetical protein